MNSSVLSNLNWLHILVAALAYFALGAIWYSFLFRDKWIRHQGIVVKDEDRMKGAGFTMFTSFILMFITSAGLAVIIKDMNLSGALYGVKLGLLTGVCFSAAVISTSYVYVKKPLGLHLIDDFYHIVGQIIAAVILCSWH